MAVLEVNLHQLFRLGFRLFPGLRLNVEGLEVLLHAQLLPPLFQSLASLTKGTNRGRHGGSDGGGGGGGRESGMGKGWLKRARRWQQQKGLFASGFKFRAEQCQSSISNLVLYNSRVSAFRFRAK